MNERLSAEVFPPGEFLRDELEARGWTQSEFAEIIGRNANLVSDLVNGKRGITPGTAKELAAALGTSALFWLNLDAAYQLHRTEPAPTRIRVEARLRERFPVRDMIARGWVEPSENPKVLEARVLDFYGIKHMEEPPRLAHAAGKTGAEPRNYAELSAVQQAWLFRVKQIADEMVVHDYSEVRLRQALDDLKGLMSAPEKARHVAGILERCGVRFIVVEPFPGSKIDGVCFWLNGARSKPVIGMSLRFDRIDNFWFVLRHEIEHVFDRDAFFDDEVGIGNRESAAPDSEARADAVASDFCVDHEEMEDFIARVQPLFSERRVIGFANRLGIDPGIVIGQLQHRTHNYRLLRQHMAAIREFVTVGAVTDGYGRIFQIS